MCKVMIKNIFGHGMKLHTVELCIDSILTIQDFTSSKTDWNIILHTLWRIARRDPPLHTLSQYDKWLQIWTYVRLAFTVIDQLGVLSGDTRYPDSRSSSRVRDIQTIGRETVTFCDNDFGVSRWRFQHPIFLMRVERLEASLHALLSQLLFRSAFYSAKQT